MGGVDGDVAGAASSSSSSTSSSSSGSSSSSVDGSVADPSSSPSSGSDEEGLGAAAGVEGAGEAAAAKTIHDHMPLTKWCRLTYFVKDDRKQFILTRRQPLHRGMHVHAPPRRTPERVVRVAGGRLDIWLLVRLLRETRRTISPARRPTKSLCPVGTRGWRLGIGFGVCRMLPTTSGRRERLGAGKRRSPSFVQGDGFASMSRQIVSVWISVCTTHTLFDNR